MLLMGKWFYLRRLFRERLHYEWEDGRKYSGEWRQNQMHRKGFFEWGDGKSYEGTYENDLKHGYGVFYWPDGKKYEGYWVNG